jgi:murein DD-endopeptidase MepM/ murein hydrolase activator NlpD
LGIGRKHGRTVAVLLALGFAVLAGYGGDDMSPRSAGNGLKGYGITDTGLRPRYPAGYACSPLTSLYASWQDVDGSTRDEVHSGVDGGRLGEPILAPASGTVRAVWLADWGWGPEGALLLRHSAEDLGLDEGVDDYYSAFYHLKQSEVGAFEEGQRIDRGQLLAHVGRPGGKAIYLPEVHWEVYEVGDDDATKWHRNERGKGYWTNRTSHLIDPLYLLSRQPGTLDGKTVMIEPFVQGRDYSGYKGFTYILPCTKRK